MMTLTPLQWLTAAFAGVCVGVGKAGLPGVSMVPIVVFALLFGARDSTGVVLPMLIMGDICAVTVFHQHARWDYVRRMVLPTGLGIVVGAVVMVYVTGAAFEPLIGWIILAMAAMQLGRTLRPGWLGTAPQSRAFAWAVGLLAGVTSMLANAAGPVMALYLMSVALPKWEFVGTTAWFFLVVNLFKLPFSFGLGLIHGHTLAVNAALAPAVVAGVLGGRWLVGRVSQRSFDAMLLVLVALAALRLLGAM